jgi:pyruvate/2-oxoglutarate/acetoin dehydrogenase E1 component
MERELSFTDSIREATDQLMENDPDVFVMGEGVDDPKAILGTTRGLLEAYGKERIFDTPLSEDAMTGVAIGAALAGLRPIHVHIRVDFLLLTMNQLINVAAKTHYMCGGQESVPLVVKAMIGKSWGQGAQHSQGLYPMFMHIPGLKVVMPSTPYDGKGALIAAVLDDNPVIFIEHRLLHYQKGPVPQGAYSVLPGKARVVTSGCDVTLVGISYMQLECYRACGYLEEKGVSVELIDPIWLNPLDIETIVESVKKTGRLCVVDNCWMTCGAASEIITQVVERLQGIKDIRVQRLGFAPVTCPTTPVLEDAFYPNPQTIAASVYALVEGCKELAWIPKKSDALTSVEFKGPF